LSKSFQYVLNACIEAAADELKRRPLPSLYHPACSHIRYQPEPWAGEGVEEFANPFDVFERGWGDCDDLVIFRGAQLRSVGLPCHARILHQVETNKYHTQLTRDFDGIVEDPSLERLYRQTPGLQGRLRKPCFFRAPEQSGQLIHFPGRYRIAA
jgi:hypothetical protein